MNVVCIKNEGYYKYLTIGNIYDAISDDDYGYIIIDNNNNKYWYPKKWFKTVAEIRNEKINKLLEDEVNYKYNIFGK